MNPVAITGAVEMGLIFALLAMGIYVNYRVLGVADLTVEGSFTMGAAVSAVFVLAGRPLLGMGVAILAGAAAGLCAAFLQTKMRVQPILAGILVMTALYSVNLFFMDGRPNIALLQAHTLFTGMGEALGGMRIAHVRLERILLPFIFTVGAGGLLCVFFHTRLGLSVRATGDNEAMVRASSINSALTKSVGLGIGNAAAALSGALLAQYQFFADINMGFGMVVVALASLIVGETLLGRLGEILFGRRIVIWDIAAVIAGAIVYRLILAFALSFRFDPANLRAISALVVTAAISYPVVKGRWVLFNLKRKARKAGGHA